MMISFPGHPVSIVMPPHHRTIARKHVLIVEDNLAALFAMRAMFRDRGWEVSCSKTVTNARTILDRSPDWVVLDLGLVDGDGEEVLRHVRASGGSSRVAVVSSISDREQLERLRPLSPDCVMPMPIDFDRLLAVCEGPPLP